MRYSNPWKYWQEVERWTKEIGHEYDFPIYTQAKERAYGGHGKPKTRAWESVISEAALEQAPELIPTGRVGLEVLFLSNLPAGAIPKHDLSNAIKTLEDAFNRRAYKDDNQIDYLKALRVYGPDEPNRIIARVYGV